MPATLLEVKKFFEEKETSKFMAEWKVLTEAERTWFKEAVGEANINA